jgi:hypothetical protein
MCVKMPMDDPMGARLQRQISRVGACNQSEGCNGGDKQNISLHTALLEWHAVATSKREHGSTRSLWATIGF